MPILEKYSEDIKQMVEDEYVLGELNCDAIGKMIGVSRKTIERYVKEIGILRNRSDAFKNAIKNGRMKYDHLKSDNKTKLRRKIINPAQRYSLLKNNNFKCSLCGDSAMEGAKLQVDHIVPIVEGGGNEDSNLQVLCRECNFGKECLRKICKK